MILIVFKCTEGLGCGKTFGITCENFEHKAFNGVYSCPVCGGFKIKTILGPVKIEKPHIIIKEGGELNNTKMAEQSQQGKHISLEQLYSDRFRDDEHREGAPKEQEQPIIDGVIQPRASPSSVQDKTKEYDEECSKYLGIAL